jgi:hypothetical protein
LLTALEATNQLNPYQGLKPRKTARRRSSLRATNQLNPYQGLKRCRRPLFHGQYWRYKSTESLSGIETPASEKKGELEGEGATNQLNPYQGLKQCH